MSADTTKGGYTAAELISRTLVLPFGTRHNREHIREVAEHIDNQTRPVHYREAAASLRALLDGLLPIDDRTMGLRYAATRLERTARDLEDEGGTE